MGEVTALTARFGRSHRNWGSAANWRNIAITLITPQLRASGNSAATQKLANNGLRKITPDKSAAVYESFPFIWPYNARSALLPERVPTGWAQGSVGDYSLMWISSAKCAQ